MPARQCEQHQHRQSGSPRLLIDTKEIGALAHSLFARWQVNLIAVLDDQFSFKVEAEGDFFFFAATLNATSSNTKDVITLAMSLCLSLFSLSLSHMLFLCKVLIGFVAWSGISQEVKLVQNQTGLGLVWLILSGAGGEVVHRDCLWHCTREQSTPSHEFDPDLKANMSLPT